MRYCLPIVFCLCILAGCTQSKQNKNETLSQPGGTDSYDDTFDEFEEEFSAKQVTISDPLQPVNQLMFNFNDFLYFRAAKPVIKGYSGIVPKPVRIGINNFFDNLLAPGRFVNCILQRKCSSAGREFNRFAINSTIGVLGFGDPALDKWDIKSTKEDLGQTLALYGFGDGFYIVWPFLGPSTCRDSIGMGGDAFLNPVRYVKPTEASIGISVFNITNNGSFHIGDYESFKEAALNPYIAMRDAYIQYRIQQIKE
jgi:phospholipid-binding lipoprotein MlaA